MFQVSPGILVREVDVSGYIPSVSTTEAAFAGVFRWGPVEKRILVDNEQNLVKRFGRPTNFNPETWFTASNFLDYGNKLWISRAADTTGNTAVSSHSGNSENLAIEADDNVLQLSNTENLAEGMKLLYSNVAGLPIGAEIVSVNASSVILSDSATANIESVSVIFRDDIVYTAVALQSDLGYEVDSIQDWDEQIVKNDDHYSQKEANGDSFDTAALYVARYPGAPGNSLRVAVCDTPSQYRKSIDLSPNAQFDVTNALTGVVGSNTLTITISPANTANATEVAEANTLAAEVAESIIVGDKIEVGNNRIGVQYLDVTGVSSIAESGNVFTITVNTEDELKLSTNTVNESITRYWEFYNVVDQAPGQSDYVLQFGNTAANDELHVVVIDEGGQFTGSPGTILEVYRNLSRATNAKGADGASIYYKDVLNQRSQYIWWANDRSTAPSNTAEFVQSSSATKPLDMRMVGGSDGPDENTVPFGVLAFAYDMFKSSEEANFSLVLQGKARGEAISHRTQLANYIIDNICEYRKDCVAFISPDIHDVVYNPYEEANDLVEFRSLLRSTSYAVMDSGYKYQYDKYNDIMRWVPLNGDIAGLCVRTDMTNAPWWSPAGYNRGQIKNVTRLAYSPNKASRDILYKNGINPVISEDGQGTFLFGDKTLLAKPSAFDRINVRRLFIVLEKAISTASKYLLFEFNDDFTRAQFRNMVNPYMRDVKGRRGVYDFLVVCDASNNPPEVIDRNEFRGAILIKPAKSINFIELTFVATRTGIEFAEIQDVVNW